jgi:hypothetical protein
LQQLEDFSRVCAARRSASITALPVRAFCGVLRIALGDRRLSNDEQVNRLAAFSLKRRKSVDFGGYCSGTSKDVNV